MFNLAIMFIYIFLALAIYLFFRFKYIQNKNIKRSKILLVRELILFCLVSYGTALFVLLFLQNTAGFTGFIDKGFLNPIDRIQSGLGVNFIPFKSISDFISMLNNPYIDNRQVVIRNILGNIVLFTPISLAMVLLWKRWQQLLSMSLFSLFVPMGIEFVQLFIGRSVDIDDVILNFTGLMVGFWIGKILMKLFPNTYQCYVVSDY